MTVGLLSALGAALLFGLATVLQALGARLAAGRSSPLLQPWTLVGTALDGVGVLLSLVALPDLSVPTLLTSPTAWAGAVAGLAAFVALLRGLERATVMAVMAPLVVLETVLPSLVGILALGDRTATGTGPLAAGGFALA